MPKLAVTILVGRKAEVYKEDWRNVRREEAYINQWISVPPTDGLLFAGIDMSLRLGGQVAKTLYQVPPVNIDLVYASGKSLIYRMIPDTAKDGLLMNCLPSTKEELETMFRNVYADHVISF